MKIGETCMYVRYEYYMQAHKWKTYAQYIGWSMMGLHLDESQFVLKYWSS